MFTQWRHAVENLAQHSPKPSQDGIADDASPPRASTDSASSTPASSSSQLAESALSSLRKSLGTHRPASPGLKQSTSTDSTTSAHTPRSRTTLEDRIRAKLVAAEASKTSSSSSSAKSSSSSSPIQVIDHPLSPVPPPTLPKDDVPADPLSPKSTPLPDSPVIEDSDTSTVPSSAITAQPLSPAIEGESATTDTVVEKEVLASVGEDPVKEEKEEEEQTEDKEEERLEEKVEEKDKEETEVVAEKVELSPVVEGKVNITEDFVNDGNTTPAADPPSGSQTPPPDLPAGLSQPIPETAEKFLEPETSVEEQAIEQPVEETKPSQLSHNDSPPTEPLETSTSTPTPSNDPPSVDEPTAEPSPIPEEPFKLELSNGHVETAKSDELDIEALQKRLKLVEQRFADVSTSFKRLQAEKAAADRVLQEMTSVQTIQEVDALRDFFQNMTMKTEMAQDEIRRLTGKLTRQEERIEELRDIHRLESKSQSDLITKLRAQVEETEALLKAGQSSAHHAEEEAKKHQAEAEKLRGEAEKAKTAAKDEEEKRTKAISLLKTVRQKLVKAEKERDDAVKELQTAKAHEKEEREKDKAEKQKLHDEIEKVNHERETAVKGLKAQFDKEVVGLKDRQEKELNALRGQYELEVITLKSLHSKEVESKSSRISDLEASLRILSQEKDEIFDQLQMRQAELESSQSHLESLQSQTMELQHQLRESTDRIALLNDEIAEAQKTQFTKVESSMPSAEVTQLLSTTEAKYEARISDLRRQLAAAERERDETEADLSKKINEKVQEVEQLKSVVGKSTKAREEEEETVVGLHKEIATLRDAAAAYQRLITDLQVQAGKVTEVETTAQAQIAEVKSALAQVEKQLEESKVKEAQARANNKTLREELRKVQSSAALLERQRNPGVGYWGAKGESTTDLRSPTASTYELPANSPRPASPATQSDEDVNYEYLRNVILQFLEHKEMRPHLVRVLSTILRFTPQETRRLVAKV